jgi:TolB-like protein/Flp pilus assembly protein TadD/predicted Ser/Thr protein kinase
MDDPHSTLSQALSGSYRILHELGRGGMAVVYLARDLKHERNVALKVIRPDVSYPGAADRFAREIRLAARLQHPHILPVLDSGGVEGQLWYTMPYVEGESLRDRLEREKQLPIQEAIRITREAAQSLEYAHHHSVIHRDIKPENILLSEDGSVLVADFGIARAIAGPATATSATGGTTQLTETGVAMGTPAYMAPEQRMGVPADARSDIYSLAAVLSEMLTGQMVAGGGGFDHFLLQLSESGPRMRIARPEISEGLETAVRRGLHPDPAARFPSMGEFARALDGSAGPGLPAARPTGRRAMFIVVLASVLVSAGLLFKALTRNRGEGDSNLRSMVVLPFVDVSGDTAEAYFAQGMADELTTTLVQMSDVRLAGQSAVARLKSSELNARDAGRKLNVATVLEGTVRRADQRLWVTAQLVNSADGIVLWAERYDRDMRDLFQVQDEIARAIATALKATLGGPPGAHPAAAATTDLEAYDLYLRGRYYWSKRGREGLTKAIDYLGRAVAQDSSFARAHAGLSMAYVVLPYFATVNPDSAIRLAEQSAERALALDSSLAEAHLALAYALKSRWKFPRAEAEFHAALALAPNDAVVHHWYGVFLYVTGRVEESAGELARAHVLDPFGSTIGTDEAEALLFSRQLPEARREIQRSLDLDSTKSDSHLVLSWILLAQGHLDSAMTSLENARRLGTGFDVRPYRSVVLRRQGQTVRANAIRKELARDYARGRALAYDVAIAAAGAGDISAALDAVERALEERSVFVTEVSLPCDPLFDPVKVDSRFEQLLASVGMRMCPPTPPPAGRTAPSSP